MQGFTELRVKYPLQSTDTEHSTLHTIRACPSFRLSRPWFDWAIINWETDDTDMDVEGQVLMMLDMTTVKFEDNPEVPNPRYQDITSMPHDIIEGDQVAFVHSAEGTRKDKSHSGRKSLIANWLEMEQHYQMVDVDSIKKPCFVIVDKYNTEETRGKYVPGYATDIITLIPKAMWSNKFLNYDDGRLINQARRNKDDSVTDADLKPYET